MADVMVTPINKITRDNLTVLIRNNILDESVEFLSDSEMMETDSPARTKNLQPISKKLFHSPILVASVTTEEQGDENQEERIRRTRKRKQSLVPDAGERFKRAYIDCEGGRSQEGMRKKVLISLFHNKEYSMDIGV